MKFLILSDEFMWTSGAWRLVREGHDVRVFCKEKEGKEHLQGMVKQVNTLDEGLNWLGKDGYFLRDDEKDVSHIRRRGHKGEGGNKWTDRVENDRIYEMMIAKQAGIKIPNYHKANNANEAIAYIKKNPDQYCLKQMGKAPKTWNFVGADHDGEDVIDQLLWMKSQPEFAKLGNLPFMLQEYVSTVEIAVGAWWQYKDWLRDADGNVVMEINREFKKEGDGDTGRTTGEMGTVAKFSTTETKLFEQTLEKLTPILKRECSDVCIDIDANCGIWDDDGKREPEAYLFEITPRFGFPICALQEHLFDMETGDFYADLIDGVQGQVKVKKDWGVVTVVGAGQFPDEGDSHEGSFKDQPVKFPFGLNDWDMHVAPFYIKYDKGKKFFRVADHYEYICGVTYDGKDIAKVNEKCVEMMKGVDVRAVHYRHDIGAALLDGEMKKLIDWGYLED
jgi:phosphoribosylamine-glycine ligase